MADGLWHPAPRGLLQPGHRADVAAVAGAAGAPDLQLRRAPAAERVERTRLLPFRPLLSNGANIDFVYLIATMPGRHSGSQVHKFTKSRNMPRHRFGVLRASGVRGAATFLHEPRLQLGPGLQQPVRIALVSVDDRTPYGPLPQQATKMAKMRRKGTFCIVFEGPGYGLHVLLKRSCGHHGN